MGPVLRFSGGGPFANDWQKPPDFAKPWQIFPRAGSGFCQGSAKTGHFCQGLAKRSGGQKPPGGRPGGNGGCIAAEEG
jgi:hypothetical protein